MLYFAGVTDPLLPSGKNGISKEVVHLRETENLRKMEKAKMT